MSDAFDDADYYTCDDDAEGLSCETPEEALEEWIDQRADPGEGVGGTIARLVPITVTAYCRRTITDRELMLEAEHLIDDAAERYLEEHGDPDGGDDFPAKSLSAAAAVVAPILRRLYALHPPWACEVIGERNYSAEEVALALHPLERVDMASAAPEADALDVEARSHDDAPTTDEEDTP